MKRKIIGMLLSSIIILSLAGCGASNGSNSYTDAVAPESNSSTNGIMGIAGPNSDFTESSTDDTDYKYEEPDINNELDKETTMNVTNKKQEKLVYSAEVELETKEFDNSITLLKEKISELNGIIQFQNYYDDEPYDYEYSSTNRHKIKGYKHFNITVRIPTEDFEKFIGSMDGIGHVRASNSQVENITSQYYNNTAYLESYQNQLEVLQEMYQHTSSIMEMLEIESRISEVQAEITKLTTEIQSMDMDVSHSTVIVSISEVTEYSDTPREYQELSFGQKVVERFKTSFTNFVHLLEALVYIFIDLVWILIALTIIIVIIIVCIKKHKQKLIKSGRITPDSRPIMPNTQVLNNTENKK